MAMWVFDNWVIMSLLAAGAWALSSVIDVCFVGAGVYTKASDGPVVAGIFCIFPAVLTSFSVDLAAIDLSTAVIGIAAGLAFLLHLYFYFKALFALNDAVNAEVFSTLSVLLVPVMAFVFLGERLAMANYFAILLTGVGIVVLISIQATRLTPAIVGNLAVSVVCISAMMVMQAWILERVSYASAVWLFSVSALALALAAGGIRKARRMQLFGMFRRFGVLLVLVQLLEIAAVLSSQRATEQGPSVSLVAMLESALPIFVMVFSMIIAKGSRLWLPTRSAATRAALSLQTAFAPAKLFAIVLITCAIFLVQ